MRRPDLFIIGAPKSGTTSLYIYLEGHPEVYMSPLKEPNYFCPDTRPEGVLDRLHYPDDEADYLRLFADARGEKRLGEASTHYLVSRDAPGLIRQFQPDARMIAMLRNPVEMLYALHNEHLSQSQGGIEDFAEALAAHDDLGGTVRPPGAGATRGVISREKGSYGEQLARWFDVFERERIHVIVFDDFAADTPAEFRRVLQFLGVSPDYEPGSFAARNASYRQRRLVRLVMDRRAVQLATDKALPRMIGENARDRLALRFRQSRFNRRSAPRKTLAVDVRRRLEDELRPDVERLSEMLSRDLVSLWFGTR